MKVIAVGTLRDFWARHPDAEQPLKAWYDEAKHAVCRTPQDVRQRFASATFIHAQVDRMRVNDLHKSGVDAMGKTRMAFNEWSVDGDGRTPQDIRQRYASASFVGHNRVVFNIKGNDYRLIVAVAYRFQAIYIKFIGTHTEYDRVDAATVEAP